MEVEFQDEVAQVPRILSDGDNTVDNVYRFYGEMATFALLLLLGLLTNGPLLVIYFRSKHIRSVVVDKFLFNMLIADALCVLILVPTILTDLILPEEGSELDLAQTVSITAGGDVSQISMSESGTFPSSASISNLHGLEHSVMILSSASSVRPSWSCAFKKSLLSGVATASILAALEIAVERYLAVVNPLHYHEFLTKTGVLSTSSIGSLIAVGSAILSCLDPCQPVFPGCVKNMSSVTDGIWWPSYTLVHVSLFFIFPIFLMTFIYIKIWWEARRQRAKMSTQYKRPFFVDVPNYGSPEQPMTVHDAAIEETRRGKKFYLHPLLLRLKLIERLVAPRMDRAARVAICTLFCTILCWGPYYFVETSHALQSLLKETSGTKAWHHYETILPLFFASLHPIIAPFFYAYRYKRVREEVLKVCFLDSCIHKNQCVGLTPRKSVVLDFHDTNLNSSASKTNQILTPVSSEVGLHQTEPPAPAHYYSPPPSPPPSPIPPKFHIGPEADIEIVVSSAHGLGSCDSQTDIPLPNGLKESQLSLSRSNPLSPTTLTFTASFIHCISAWWTSYSARWANHRNSIASTSSVASFLSSPPKIIVTPEDPPIAHI